MDIEQIVLNIIIHSGEARAYAYDALRLVRGKEYKEEDVTELLDKASEAIGKAHEIQTSLLHEEAEGKNMALSILFVHAQDHLMTAISEKNLITEMIELTKTVNQLTATINQGGKTV